MPQLYEAYSGRPSRSGPLQFNILNLTSILWSAYLRNVKGLLTPGAVAESVKEIASWKGG